MTRDERDGPKEELHGFPTSVKALSAHPKPHSEHRQAIQQSHPWFFPKPRPEIQGLDLSQLDEIDAQCGGAKSEKVRLRPTVEQISS